MYHIKQRALKKKLQNAQGVHVDWGKGNHIKNMQDKRAVTK